MSTLLEKWKEKKNGKKKVQSLLQTGKKRQMDEGYGIHIVKIIQIG